MRKTILSFWGALLFLMPQLLLAESAWYAGISRAPGLNGSFWKTEGLITNVSCRLPVDGDIVCLPETVALNFYGPATSSFNITVPPASSTGATDVVTTLGLPDGTYVVNVNYPANTNVVFRTYNDLGDAGTYGATLPKLTAYENSFVSWPVSTGRRWLYVVVLDNASFDIKFYQYNGTYQEALSLTVDGTNLPHGFLGKYFVPVDTGFVVIKQINVQIGHPGGYEPNPQILPYGTGVDNLTGAPNIFTATPVAF